MKNLSLFLICFCCTIVSFSQIRRLPDNELPFPPTKDSSVYIFYVQDFDKIPERDAHLKIIDKTHDNTIISEGKNNIDGIYITRMPLGIDYRIEISTADTVFTFDETALPSPSVMDFDLRVKLVVHEYKRTFNLNVLFDSGDHKLDLDDMSNLAVLLNSLNGNPKMKIEIAAHTDNVGDDNSNMRLSYLRAKSVKDFLIKEGIAESRILSKGYGEAKPIDTNDTAEGRKKNRRVEVRVIEE